MMRRITYLFLLLALPMLSLANDQVNTLFAKANGQYAKAKYKDAVQTYQDILKGGYQSAAVYFNLGNAYYKSGDIPSALLYYQKAHKLSPRDEDINFNIQLSNLKTTDKIETAPGFFLTNWWNTFILGCTANALGWLTVLFVLIGFGALIGYLFTQSITIKKTTFFGGLTFILLGLITILMAANQAHYYASHHQAVVFSNSVTVKSEPGASGKNLFVIHNGTTVDIVDDNKGWIRIKLANGNEGWMLAGDVKEI